MGGQSTLCDSAQWANRGVSVRSVYERPQRKFKNDSFGIRGFQTLFFGLINFPCRWRKFSHLEPYNPYYVEHSERRKTSTQNTQNTYSSRLNVKWKTKT